jgi:NAD(P)-dependent dehydrogenase (short-subunit alcohol dehydrogenase family)
MSHEMNDKVAIVTGGTRGIGYGLAKALLAEGAKVFICGRQETSLTPALQALSSAGQQRVAGITADVGKYEDCKKLVDVAVERFGRVDILINNAGVGHVYKPVDQITPEIWDATIQTNLSGMFYCCHAAIPIMRKAGAGYIFNISSVAEIVRLPGGSAYNASKCGVSGFTETLMKDVRYDGIRASEIVIGSVSTDDRGYEHWKLAVEDVVQLVMDLYKWPSRALVGRVELWPSQPPPYR